MGSVRALAGTSHAMAVGKNKRLTKGKKGSKKKIIDPFTLKDWYDVKAPSMFLAPQCGKTLTTRTKGTKIASEGLKGRLLEVSLVLCNFWGMDFTTDKLRSLVRKWQS